MRLRRALFVLSSALACAHGGGDPARARLVPFGPGAPFALGALRGSIVVVDLWASWCAPCRESLPAHAALARELEGRGVRLLAVSEDADVDAARAFARSIGLGDAAARDDDGELAEALGVTALPTVLVLDRAGAVRLRYAGAAPADEERLRREVLRLAGER